MIKVTYTSPNLLDGPRWSGLRIGLLGGSFNPPHEGHVHISRVALQRLNLDFVWWLVTPHNPLKEKSSLMPYEERVELCRRLVHDPRILVTDLEARAGVNRTFDTLAVLRQRFPRTDFTLLAGTDNALIFHKWDRWREILAVIPTAFIARPPAESLVQGCPLRQTTGNISWILDTGTRDISSTALRNKKGFSMG